MEERKAERSGAALRRAAVAWATILLAAAVPAVALGNAITVENALPGSPASEWDISGAGDLSIQGFATDISVNPGDTVTFKIKTDAAAYHIEIYRLGYYQGNGARHVGSGVVTVTLPQTQPADLYDSVTGLTDCGNWAESARWNVPAGAVSGIYIAKLIRDDTQGASHIAFVVRDDASHSDLLVKTSDCTWQAYNVYGGNSLYVGSVSGYPSGHAPKVSYNRPFYTRNGGGGGSSSEDWLFNAEYPMVRWLEANGYDVTYTTDVDADRRGNLIANHKAFLSVGHDEYWSAGERASVAAARDAGTHLAFFSGNEIYWKTRWEPSIDGSGTAYRTLVCYKEGTLGENVCGGKCDPLPDVWTGLWRDGCAFTPPADGCRPENALSGQISWDGSTGTLRIPDTCKNLRFWRNTAVAGLGAGQTLDLTPGTLGYEWDWQQYAEHYPSGRVLLSTTDFNGKTHHLSLYRAPSGALVFGAGTVQWSWGLDSHHDRGSAAPHLAMQQATVNLFAEMGAQPASLQSGLTAVASTGDAAPPSSVIGFPASGASLPSGTPVTLTGTSSDAAGLVMGVEISVDGGATWQPATGTTSWSYSWTPAVTGSVTLEARAYDDLGNLESAGAPGPNLVTVTVTPGGAEAPPTVTATTPGNNATGVATNAAITATFSEALDPATVTAATFELRDAADTPVAASVEYDAPSLTATLTPGTLLSAAAVYTARLVGGTTDPRIKDVAGNALATDYGWSFTTAAPDLSPPFVMSTSPASGAGGVAPTAAVSAVFSEALSPSTVSAGTFELRDALNALVPAAVSYNVYTHTATLTPSAALTAGPYTARLAGGSTDPRIKDLAGNALAADYTWSFTAIDFNCPCTVWSPATVPGTVADSDTRATELGMKFRASVNGYVTGVRYYKSATNTGTHVGSLWNTAGVSLASATFTGETASGWQEVTFAAPVAITAGTTYIVSYHTDTGHYSQDVNYFQSGVDAPPLRALSNGEDGPNGLYTYATTSAFPTSEFSASNYWVDAVFATAVGPDTLPPTVVSHVPASGATGVAPGAAVTATFSEAIDPATVDGTTFELRDALDAVVPATVAYSVSTRTASLAPASTLAYSATYTATIRGGATDPRIKDPAGNPLAADVTWSFATAAPPPPPPTEGPGGPILVIGTAANPFSRYFAEILRAEGLNEFTAMDISLVTPAVLGDYDVVVLGEMPLGSAQVTMLGDWTDAGGTLIAMRPDAQLAGLLGITPAGGTLADKYLLVNTASGPGAGIVGQTIQFHGTADLYTLSGATSVATLYSDATTATTNPAVTMRSVGANGGQAMAFTYDLARSVVYTRQGNPAWSGQKRDGQMEPIRSDDLFFGNAAGDPQPDWVDFNKIAIPQADEQQRLLANAITLGNLHKKPLPRFWYLPKGLKAAIVMTGDDHGDAGMAPRFDIYRTESPAGCSVDDWECVRATGYEYVGSGFTDAQAVFYNSIGFEVALHINTNCARATPAQYDDFATTQLAAFASTFPGIPAPSTNRNHCIAWSDWSSVAEVSVAHGIRFDTNYYYWPSTWVQNRSGMFTGSGIPMRFAKLDGTMIDCYQGATQMPDESGESFPAFCDQLLDRANGPEGYYGVFTTNMHFDTANHAGSNAIVASAQARGVPVVSAKQMLTWLDGRNGSSFSNLAWSGNTLSFAIVAAAGSRNLRAMLPTQSAVGQLTGITLNATPIAYTTQTVKGVEYAFFPGDAGDYAATYQVDETAPLITAVVASPHDDGTATVTWTTNEASDSRVDYGTSEGALTLNAGSASFVTSHSVTLTGLSPSTTYYFRATSADAAGNGATAPPTASAPLSFSTPAPVCFRDQSTADFAAGTAGPGAAVVTIADGDVTLQPAAAAEFTVLPSTSEWLSVPWTTGGTSTVSGGVLTTDGARLSTQPSTTTFGPGTSVEYVATFSGVAHQYVGFGAGTDGTGSGSIYNTAPWAMFGTGNTGAAVQARVNLGGTLFDFTVPGSLLGAAHKYRVDWKTSSIDFFVDDTLAHTENLTVAGPMRVAISDLTPGAPAVTVDWIHVTPYASNGTFTSRVFDGGTATTWGEMSWTASLPTGTSLQMLARQGDTAVPDGSWTVFTAVPASGTVIGGASRYVQYRADLATTVPSLTPVLEDVHVSCATGPDSTAPVITSVVATPGVDGTSAMITWNTNELATSRVDYGTDAGSLLINVGSGTLTGAHTVVLPGLTPGLTYYYRVTSLDGAGNGATQPPLASGPLSFTTSAGPCASDGTAADFASGTPGAATYVSETMDGEVILRPAEGAEFSGTSLPTGWISAVYGGSPAVVSGGHVSVDGAYAATSALYGPGRSVEFVATFDAAAAGQHAGFGTDLDGAPWAIFSTHGGGVLEARSNPGSETNEIIPNVTLGVPHRFRIDWSASQIVYWIDGTIVATHDLAIASNMRPIVSDGPVGGNPMQADWMRMTPYAASGSYTSRIFDGGGATLWGIATWTSLLPAGTSLALFERHGNTPAPDGTWSSFAAVPASGTDLAASGRFLQYRADLASTDPIATPSLLDVSVGCTSTPDGTPPVISAVTAVPGTDGVSATVTWSTDELANSRVDFGTSPESLTSPVTSAAFTASHSLGLTGLLPATTYYYRVTSVDVSGNSATSPTPPATLAFTTPAAPCPADQTAADFGLGTLDANTVASLEGDGEVILKPSQANVEFTGAALPADWSWATWAAGGTATVGGGALTVDGAHASTNASFGPGRSLEFVATYTAANYQNVGFAADGAFGSPWLTIGMGTNTTGVFARTSTNAEVLLSSSTLGTPHRYRIDWTAANTFLFYVDGVNVPTPTLTFAVSTNMVAIVSDLAVGGNSLSVDWLRVTPYATSGTFVSRVFDGLGPTSWGAAAWTSSTPSGTALSIFARTGNTPVPDGSWSSYDPLTNGASVGANSRYIQYRADLTSSAPGYATPVLRDLAIACVAGPDVSPPVITSVVATPATNGQSATVTWTTDEPATSRVDYGTSASSLNLNVSDGARVRSHSLTLTGLSSGVTYDYRVRSADASANEATEPVPPGTLNFTTPLQACLSDIAEADFVLGAHSGTTVSLVADGEVILAPALQQEFSGTSLPSDWTSVLWSDGAAGGGTVSGGKATEDGARLSPVSLTTYGPGHVLEFVATFASAPYQHVGFGSGDNSVTGGVGMFNRMPWAMFSTGTAGTQLQARVAESTTDDPLDLGSSYLDSPHRYRIEWKAAPDSMIFLIDGASVRRMPVTMSAQMRPGISDYTAGGATVQVDWIRMTPYTASGTFVSRVYDAGTPASWGAMTWAADVPGGTSLTMSVRKGDTPAPDGSWSAFTVVPTPGSTVGGLSRYIQYRAELAANATLDQTPALEDVGITCGPCNAGAPAVIADLAATGIGNAGGGRANVRVNWSGVTPGDLVAVYRKAYGDYPLYRADHGGAPTAPASPAAAVSEGWALTSVGASGGLDAPPARGFWYYVAYVTNACGVVSGASNRTAGTLDYVLGDVSNGTAVCTGGGEAGDAIVNTADLSALGGSYGQSFASTDDRVCLDVGPTVDYGTRSRPAPDGVLDFEDLVVYALDYEIPLAAPALAARAAGRVAAAFDELRLDAPQAVRAGEPFDVVLHFGGTGTVHALSARLAWDRGLAEITGYEAGDLLAAAGGVLLSPAPGALDAAVLGAGVPGLLGAGGLAVVHFRALAAGEPLVRLASSVARDAANRPVTLGATAAPAAAPRGATAMGPVFPNPFPGTLNISFSLSREANVKLLVFDLAGRVVRHLEEGTRPAGTHLVTWDGRADAGHPAAAGLYIVRFESGEVRQARRVQLIR